MEGIHRPPKQGAAGRGTMNRPLINAGWIGIAVILMSIVLLAVFPSRMHSEVEGFSTPIIAFEFAGTPEEVYRLFGREPSQERDAMAGAMDRGNRLDFAYMVLYSLFLFLFSILSARESGTRFLYLGAALSVVALGGDILENIQLLGITENLATGDFQEELRRLSFFTWQKWGAIAGVFLVLIAYFRKGGFFARLIAAWGGVTVLLAILSFIHRSVVNEVFSLAVALQFLFMIIYSFTHRTKVSPQGFHNF